MPENRELIPMEKSEKGKNSEKTDLKELALRAAAASVSNFPKYQKAAATIFVISASVLWVCGEILGQLHPLLATALLTPFALSGLTIVAPYAYSAYRKIVPAKPAGCPIRRHIRSLTLLHLAEDGKFGDDPGCISRAAATDSEEIVAMLRELIACDRG